MQMDARKERERETREKDAEQAREDELALHRVALQKRAELVAREDAKQDLQKVLAQQTAQAQAARGELRAFQRRQGMTDDFFGAFGKPF